jgi:hypothetical protein
MTLDIPVSVLVLGIVVLVARDLDLLKSPLGQDGVTRDEVTSRVLVSEPEARRERVDTIDLVTSATEEVIDDFDDPVVVRVSDRVVAVSRDLVVEGGDGCSDGVRVEVATGRVVDESHDGSVREVDERGGGVVVRHLPGRRDDELVVLVLVVVAGDLLLLRSNGVGSDVRVEKSSSVAHVLERHLGSVRRFYSRRSSSAIDPRNGVERWNSPSGLRAKSLPSR